MIHITIYLGDAQRKNEKYNGGYKYLFTRGAMSWTANHTTNGFLKKLEVIGGEVKLKWHEVDEQGNGTICLTIEREVSDDNYFYDLKDLPQGVQEFMGLSNGSWNKCYYLQTPEKLLSIALTQMQR